VDVELRTPRLLLRPFRSTDRGAFARWADDPAYRRHLGPDHPGVDEFVEHNAAADGETELAWVVSLLETDAPIGSVFLGVERPDGLGHLACLIGPDHWGRGVGTEAARAVIDYAFARLGLAKVYARAAAGNTASVRGMETLGMRCEGRLREQRIDHAGNRVDELVYGLLQAEWAARNDG
jgi:ribosomal-protein-alanine N-acetyltransferase